MEKPNLIEVANISFCFRSQRLRAFARPALRGSQEPPPKELRRFELLAAAAPTALGRLLQYVRMQASCHAKLCDRVQSVHARFFVSLYQSHERSLS